MNSVCAECTRNQKVCGLSTGGHHRDRERQVSASQGKCLNELMIIVGRIFIIFKWLLQREQAHRIVHPPETMAASRLKSEGVVTVLQQLQRLLTMKLGGTGSGISWIIGSINFLQLQWLYECMFCHISKMTDSSLARREFNKINELICWIKELYLWNISI